MKILAKTDIKLISIIVLVSAFTWKIIPQTQFMGEGYMPFIVPEYSFKLKNLFVDYNVLQRILFDIIAPIFQDRVHLYMYLMFIWMLITDALMYILAKVATGNRLISFLIAFLFSISAVSKYDMFANGGYQYFSERAIILPFQIIALTLFIRYFQTLNFRFYISSLLIYFFSITMAMFGTWFLAPFLFYPVFYFLVQTKRLKKDFLKLLWTGVPFALGNLLIIARNPFTFQEESVFLTILKPNFDHFMLYQLSVITLPPDWYFPVSKIIPQLMLGYFILAVYLLAFLIVSKKSNLCFSLLLTAFFSLLLMLLFNIKHGAAVLGTTQTSRFFYFPYVMVAIFWGIFFSSFSFKKILPKILLGLFLIFWTYSNFLLIEKNYKAREFEHKANRETIEKVRELAPKLKNNPGIIFFPSILGTYGSDFIIRFLLHPQTKSYVEGFVEIDPKALSQTGLNPENIFYLHYDPKSQKVIDRSEELRRSILHFSK